MRFSSIAWNFAGLATPAIAAGVAIPGLLASIGAERFGLLTLAWGIVGFAGMFDLGVGRATTQAISRLRGTAGARTIPSVLHSAERVALFSGLIGTIIFALIVYAGLPNRLKFSPELRDEVTLAGYILAVTIPAQSISAMYRGVNEAFESFREISLLRIAIGAMTFLGPYFVSKYSANLAILVTTLFISRVIGFWFSQRIAYSGMRIDSPGTVVENLDVGFSSTVARHLLVFGGWLTITGVVYPIMMQADRFMIGSKLSSAAIAEYSIPYELVLQTLSIVGAVTTVAFPQLSAMAHSDDRQLITKFFGWLWRIASLMAMVAGAIGLSLPKLLPLWLGTTVPPSSVAVGQILCLGLVPYTVGTMYASIVHASSRPDITAKCHLIQLPLYLVFVYWMTSEFGVIGAAWAWNVRTAVDVLMVATWFHVARRRKHSSARAAS